MREGSRDLAHLFTVGFSVLQHLFGRQRRPGHVLARRIADGAGKVPYQEKDLVTEVLEVLQLVQQHGVTEV